MPLAAALPYETAVATRSALEISSDRIAERRAAIQSRNRERTGSNPG